MSKCGKLCKHQEKPNEGTIDEREVSDFTIELPEMQMTKMPWTKK